MRRREDENGRGRFWKGGEVAGMGWKERKRKAERGREGERQ